MGAHKMIHPKAIMDRVSPIAITKEIIMGILISIPCGFAWKRQQWESQRAYKLFYSQLEKGEISVVAED